MARPNGPRDPIAGPDTPQSPFPLKLRGPVIKGFGRGSKELGIPTANIPITGLNIGGHENLSSGIYYGFASLDKSTITQNTSASTDTSLPTRSSNHAVADLEPPSSTPSSAAPSRPLTPSQDAVQKPPRVYPTVLSIGYNPYYKNTHRSIEIHLLHTFSADFYGATLSLVILGFIRPEYDYVSKDALVEDIRQDIRVARRSLERPAYETWREDTWLLGGEAGGAVGAKEAEG
ncbi:riboflavin kinase [Lindgomyces ingoldianus]|uniref:Riboflavin kinase n=1 Tax=Lindgomyces ingoldianus TaxID=673940 RepID=A0ACB6R1W0_9PLEO|nr:riboflavin kinase [Lindgomyces ingoldianus]KAF2472497.1 riboflavin kinase [Lindgomyces ingoldianus]